MNRTLALLGKELADLRQNLTIFLPATLSPCCFRYVRMPFSMFFP